MPKVSVLMPAYNSEKYIAEAIDSILSQTFTDFEFIIINDGSTDKTAEIVRRYTDKRIKFIDNKKNQGLIAVLNQGLDLCTGEYIARMDSDDISMPTRFAKQVEYMDANPDVGVLGTAIQQFGALNQSYIYKSVISYMDLIQGCTIAHPSVFIRRDILEKYTIRYKSEYIHAEDYNLWAQIIMVTKIHNLTDVLYKYRWHDTNVSVLFNDIQNQTAQRIRQEMLNFLTDVPEIRHKLGKVAKLTRFFNPTYLTRHMKKHHPIRYNRLKHQLNKCIDEKHIPIFMTTDENYARYVAISVASICHNTSAICDIYLLCDNVSYESKQKISDISNKYPNCNIKYIDLTDEHRQYVRDTYLTHNKKQSYTTNLSNYSRFLMPNLIPNIKKALYLDTDIVVKGDILPLFETDLGQYPLGAVPCSYVLEWPELREKTLKYLSQNHTYFNAGVMLIDCDAWRKDNIGEKIAECDRQIYDIKLFNTQDPLNKCFDCNYKPLLREYNFDGTMLKTDNVNDKNHIIRHFTATKPDMGPTKIASSDMKRFMYFARRTKFLPQIRKNIRWQYKIIECMPHIFCIKWGGLCLFGLVRISKVKK